jgi:hypothetical protein
MISQPGSGLACAVADAASSGSKASTISLTRPMYTEAAVSSTRMIGVRPPTGSDVPPPSLLAMQAIADAQAERDVHPAGALHRAPMVEVLVARVEGTHLVIEFVFDYTIAVAAGFDHHIYVGTARFGEDDSVAASSVTLLRTNHHADESYDRDASVHEALTGR